MKRRLFAGLLTVMMFLTLVACGGSASSNHAAADTAPGESVSHSMSSGAMKEESVEMEMEMGYLSDLAVPEAMEEPGKAPSDDSAGTASGQKLIRNAWLELESTEFDEASRALKELTEEFGGYFENSSVANYKDGARWGDYTVRIPAERFDAFLEQAGTLCHLTWQEMSQEDISEIYYDTAGRLETQKIKLERLQELLAKAEKMEDIITLESAISETEWMIEDLSGTLRRYDGKVDYATVHINLREVYKLSSVETVPESFGQRMSAAFADGLRDCGDRLEDLAVAFAYSWMWWLLFVAVVAGVVRFVRKRVGFKWTLRRKKKDDKHDEV
jgi:hypothetical protein